MGGARVSLARNPAAAEKSESESESGPRRRNFVSLRGKQKFLLFACPVASRRFYYGARPSVQFLPRFARQSVGISFKKGSSFVQQLRSKIIKGMGLGFPFIPFSAFSMSR
ncbi:hypothetical protein CO134_00150 [Candidatus Kuenenbacteria bacterium CG_4_9_14_3_um_filter_39_14]|uniref:Uncharacterized protein n=1 Tax=Candidatus Kuenenbacteria bacterium CG_4_9_14_3_um_filter_39_14 TaxID=1974616 RepID=A0A2M7ZAC1_9BACT|nr:MAG: hypothetical protein CO134_00150 [Candidatus Kuenenbacteria bacterium CG_4_9_14_3_um_filter_39_14]